MRAQELYKLGRRILLADLKQKGFSEKSGEYIRILEAGVVHLIGIAKDPHGAETFRVMCGVDTTVLKDASSAVFGYIKKQRNCHITPCGWHYNSGRWPCTTSASAEESLLQVRQLIHDLALPWLDEHTTISSVSDEIDQASDPLLGWLKAKLYLSDGDITRARQAAEEYAAFVARPRNWGTKEKHERDKERAAQLLREVEAIERRDD